MTRLKRLPPEDWAAIWEWRDQPGMTNAAIRERILKTHGISLGCHSHLERFWGWQYRQMQWERLNEMAAQDEQMLREQCPDVDRDRLRDAAIKRLYAVADMRGDPKLGLQVVATDLHDSVARRDWEKFRLQQQKKIKAGLDELAQVLQQHPDLLEEYRAWRARFAERLKAEG